MDNRPAKKTAGRPPKWESSEVVAAVIDDYFKECEVGEKPPTIAGLAIALGVDRRTLLRYAAGEGRDDFVTIIKRARLLIEAFHERRLFSSNPTGSIFWLKNHAGYADRQEHGVKVSRTLEDILEESHQEKKGDPDPLVNIVFLP